MIGKLIKSYLDFEDSVLLAVSELFFSHPSFHSICCLFVRQVRQQR